MRFVLFAGEAFRFGDLGGRHLFRHCAITVFDAAAIEVSAEDELERCSSLHLD